jgi:glycosyltransferase involved in cell wall biosynthesis
VTQKSVLLVEHRAYLRAGHFMAALETFANAMIADGHTVHVLADGPLAIEAEGRTIEGVAGVHQVGPGWSRLGKWGMRLASAGGTGRGQLVTRPIRNIGNVVSQWCATRSVASCGGRLGGIPTLVLSSELRADWAAAFAPRSARWAVYELGSPRSSTLGRTSLVGRMSKRRERRRQQSGGWVRIVANNPAGSAAWRTYRPWLRTDLIPMAGVAEVTPERRDRARSKMGLDPDRPIALTFGTVHSGKDVRTITLAFSGDDAPAHLVATGLGIQQVFDDVRRDHPEVTFPHVTILDGPQTDEVKRLLHSCADYVVLSFPRDLVVDSGSLADAVAYGLPVCCSLECSTGEVVREHGLGLLFSAGDPDSLRERAHQMATFAVRPEDRAHFAESRSVTALSRRLLAAMADE